MRNRRSLSDQVDVVDFLMHFSDRDVVLYVTIHVTNNNLPHDTKKRRKIQNSSFKSFKINN